MLVRAINDYKDYGDTVHIHKDTMYIVYAISRNPSNKEYYVLPAGDRFRRKIDVEPLYFPAEWFEVVANRVSPSWITKTVTFVGDKKKEYTSFPEWFKGSFYIRANDWNMDDDDFKIMEKYIKKYEELYKDYLQ